MNGGIGTRIHQSNYDQILWEFWIIVVFQLINWRIIEIVINLNELGYWN